MTIHNINEQGLPPTMLEKIAQVKTRGPCTFTGEQLEETVTLMHKSGFLERSPIDMPEKVTVKPITIVTDLLAAAIAAQSCMVGFPPTSQIMMETYVSDPAALYFALNSPEHQGYFRFYAAEENGREILFEDVLRTCKIGYKPPSDKFHPEFKAVVALTLIEYDLAPAYLQFSHHGYEDKGCQLTVTKLGYTDFQRSTHASFYRGKVKPYSPRFWTLEDATPRNT